MDQWWETSGKHTGGGKAAFMEGTGGSVDMKGVATGSITEINVELCASALETGDAAGHFFTIGFGAGPRR